jgi:homoserine kinase
MQVCVRSYASIANLGPGFDVLALALSNPYDDVLVRLLPSGPDRVRFIGEYGRYLPSNFTETTIYPVVEEFRKLTGQSFYVDVVVKKGIKPASGLGSSGADAVAVAYALNKLLNTGLTETELIRVAALGEVVAAGSPHMDNVAASLLGGLVIINPVTGDVVRIEVPGNYWFVIVTVGSKASTGEMRRVIPRSVDLDSLRNNMSYVSMLVYSLITGDVHTLRKAIMGDAIIEPIRSKFYPHYNAVKEALLKAGAVAAALSGAGPSLFGVFTEEPREELLRKLLHEYGIRDYVLIISKPRNAGVHEIPCDALG